jgi:inhibitor of cysteine peptidase
MPLSIVFQNGGRIMKTLTKAFNAISVRKGEIFRIDLDANPTTGYLWDVRLTAGKASLVSQNYSASAQADSLVIGGGGVESFVYKAEEAGTIEFKAEYRRPWEDSTLPAHKKSTFTVKVS